jgi:hypothetical protein
MCWFCICFQMGKEEYGMSTDKCYAAYGVNIVDYDVVLLTFVK